MSAPEHGTASPRTGEPSTSAAPETAPGWVVGMTTFAAITLVVIGVFHIFTGIAALFRNEIYVVGQQYVYSFDLTTWGWIHLLFGVVVVAAGFGVVSGQLWGRMVGIALAALSMIANFMFIPYYPLWSMLIIALDVFVIWALCLYSRETARARAF